MFVSSVYYLNALFIYIRCGVNNSDKRTSRKKLRLTHLNQITAECINLVLFICYFRCVTVAKSMSHENIAKVDSWWHISIPTNSISAPHFSGCPITPGPAQMKHSCSPEIQSAEYQFRCAKFVCRRRRIRFHEKCWKFTSDSVKKPILRRRNGTAVFIL